MSSSSISGDGKVAAVAVNGFKFEVFGRVQRVFFRKYTQEVAMRLSLRGYVKNTPHNTVTGIAIGDDDAAGVQALAEFRKWLQEEGSPKSTIDRVVFTDIVSGSADSDASAAGVHVYSDFSIDRSYGHAPKK